MNDAEILEREKRFWTDSIDYYERWLARDVFMVFPPPAGILDRDKILAGIQQNPRWLSVEMSNTVVRRVGESTILLAYEARARRDQANTDYRALVGSAYIREDEWKLVFHQHTPIASATAA